MPREYFSERAGRTQPGTIKVRDLKLIFEGLYNKFENAGYFQYHFGKDCVNKGYITGKAGLDMKQTIVLRFGTERKLFPTHDNIRNFNADDLFDLIEFLHDYVAKPTKTFNDEWNDCGLHVTEALGEQGRVEWITQWNPVLARLDFPYRFTKEGIIEVPPSSEGLKKLVDERKLYDDEQNVDAKVKRACHLFLSRNATFDNKREALRELADVLEFLRGEMRKKLPKKETSNLFNIANN